MLRAGLPVKGPGVRFTHDRIVLVNLPRGSNEQEGLNLWTGTGRVTGVRAAPKATRPKTEILVSHRDVAVRTILGIATKERVAGAALKVGITAHPDGGVAHQVVAVAAVLAVPLLGVRAAPQTMVRPLLRLMATNTLYHLKSILVIGREMVKVTTKMNQFLASRWSSTAKYAAYQLPTSKPSKSTLLAPDTPRT